MEEQRNQQFLCVCTEARSGRDLERQGLLLRENLSLGTKMLADKSLETLPPMGLGSW